MNTYSIQDLNFLAFNILSKFENYQGSHQNLQISHFQIHVCQKINLIILQITFFLEYYLKEQFLLCIESFRI